MTKKHSFIDTVFKDKNGKVVLWQIPNGPLMLWVVAEVLNELVARGTFQKLCAAIAFGALFTWAWLEIFQGASYARRALGVVVIVFSIYSKIK